MLFYDTASCANPLRKPPAQLCMLTVSTITLEQLARISSYFFTRDRPIYALSIGVSLDIKIHFLVEFTICCMVRSANNCIPESGTQPCGSLDHPPTPHTPTPPIPLPHPAMDVAWPCHCISVYFKAGANFPSILVRFLRIRAGLLGLFRD